ncbi:MAG: hypothetical protein GW906_02025 [Epsilonproteobacteria bacterium]|nr:hypothetical protein [Campylobacterota bacterium]OIO14498.1 MAG: hypothetical protein AUJ81_09320 [Helicobacteraceae bacterium CG1_02_36_14]PIP10456.1 MAG: hypothetical protein COX50_05805 [Sulfurimonas sp. CG23_combo_of_CG06-09_8_20_14_all_36_33]PIS26671.1 MAG: hypothetical protein COT46_01780 [Sulfurimonas sp. CG08_land_8_20_14_0_20_36_33]PIU33482.1 MAG: hypothetical protein COT05_12065 [Sulfurimonas sp. CG07_land_8_20_14_0_80_36_56]PIV04926.1 MAG: hypothetical protein COS56_03360 [Sulfur
MKNSHISKIQIAISKVTTELLQEDLDESTKATLHSSLKRNEAEVNKLSDFPLDKFDEALKRLKSVMLNSMIKMSSS